MYPIERQQKMIELLEDKGMMKLSALSKVLQVSMETVRRDVQTLVEQGAVTKFYGGIKLVKHDKAESLLATRLRENLSEKERIAQRCASFIEEGDSIFLDSGTTTFHIAKYIKHYKQLTVITNSLPIVLELINSELNVIIIGGKLRQSENSITAYEFLFNFERLNISKAFICTSGISVEKGLSDFNVEEVQTRRQIIHLAKKVFVAADHSKFEKDVTVQICDIKEIDYIVTDHILDAAYGKKYEKQGVQIITTV
ncbi:DeoR/GlpR family DNA-binding transcription regulator [Lysinibacillus sp. KU-BSD001]|uniref:DeoR/GlpR family DNA-binding transcription regulator n=1 Tax=Lysinibacillus sp. KU-BSD001 TaxID=3141328 RepID=UPI0036E60D21